MSGSAFTSLEETLNKYIPKEELVEVKRILYGQSQEWVFYKFKSWYDNKIFCWCPNRKVLEISKEASTIAKKNDFEVKSYVFDALPESTRPARIVKVGAVQNSIVLPTSAPILDQRNAIFDKVKALIDAAGAAGVNVLCLQEAWSEFRLFLFWIKF